MTLKWPVLTLLSLLLPFITLCQPNYDPVLWDYLETDIKQKRNLKITYNRLEDIKTGALRQKDHNTYARALFCQMLIRDLRTEDSLYFENSAFIDSILLDPRTPADLQLPMHVMQAHRLANFNRKSGYRKARYYKPASQFNYAAFTEPMLDSVIFSHYEQAKSGLTAFEDPDPEKYLWLSSNPVAFLFKPTLADIVQAEQIAYSATVSRFDKTWLRQFSRWLHMSVVDFVNVLDSIKSTGRHAGILRLYAGWLNQHKNDTAAYFFIESLARKYIYEKVRFEKGAEAAYEEYLLAGNKSPIDEVKAHSVYQLCLLWNSRAKKYDPNNNKFPPVKALQLYENNKLLFDRFSYLGRVLEEMKKQLLAAEISWQMNDFLLPNEPVLAKIEYKNAPGLYYRIVPVSFNERLPYKQDSAVMYLLSKPFLRSVTETLPAASDLAQHRTFLKIDPLPAGAYRILFAAKEMKGYEKGISMMSINVTQTAILPADGRLYVLNRKNGLPLQGARVSVGYKDDKIVKAVIGRKGYLELKKKDDYDIEVINGRDTLAGYNNETEDDLKERLQDMDPDDILEHYIDNARIHILTDRSIYRPGQTVHYKGIIMTKDPYTGDNIIVNKKNLQHGLFRNFLKKWLYEEEPEMYITDPFNREVDTIIIKPNEFGSISGSYRLPANAATGEWEFDSDIDEYNYRSSAFRVEEYKRPAFELTAEPPVRSYLPGDTVTFKLKVSAFSGSSLANTRISYNIKRTVPGDMPEGILEEMEIDSFLLTGADGLAEIIVADTALRNIKLTDSIKLNFHYSLSATAVDLSGESHEVESDLLVSNQPVNIVIPVKGKYFIYDMKPALVTANDPNKVELAKEIKIKLFRKKLQSVNVKPAYTNYADQWKYSEAQLTEWFPDIKFTVDTKQEEELVYETTVNTGKAEKLRFPAGLLSAGEYVIEAASYDNNIVRGESRSGFTIFDTASHRLPTPEPVFFQVPFNRLNPGDAVQVYTGSAFDSTCVYLQLKYYSRHTRNVKVVSIYRQLVVHAGVHAYRFPLPKDVIDRAMVTMLILRNNELYQRNQQLYISRRSTNPAIIIEQFRNKLTPGQQTTFSVSVKTADHNVAAELMSTMYDASLDKLEEHSWVLPDPAIFAGFRINRARDFNGQASGAVYFDQYTSTISASKVPLWWMGHSFYRSDEGWQLDNEDYDKLFLQLQGRVPGISITNATGIDEVIVVGYGSKRSMTGSMATVRPVNITIRGINSVVGNDHPLIVLDGVVLNGDWSGVNMAEVTDVAILKDADATAIYGSRAASGVVVMSTRGPVKLPEVKQEPVVKVRSNFNELAFFYPAVHADRDGFYRFTFTVPESLTEWNWKLFAHTKKAQFAYAERKLSTQLPFMIQPNMPRQLYQGDRLLLKSRISNLDSVRRAGKAVCKIEDVVTGEDITALVVKNMESNFDVAAQSNTVTGFELRIPSNQLNPIKVIVKAMANEFSDGEEHIIPVMTGKVLVKHAVPFSLTDHNDTLISLPVAKEGYGLGLSIQPKPQSALINSLPFLANYSFDCAEQTFNKMLANIMAIGILRADTAVQRAYAVASQIPESAHARVLLPNQVSEQSMPWLHLNTHSALQQKQLAALFDTVRTKTVIEKHMMQLLSLQNKDGGLSWFKGGNSDPYISAYVLAGFGKLLNNAIYTNFVKAQKTQEFIVRLVQYLDGNLEYNDIFCAYARGYWKGVYPVGETNADKMKRSIELQWERVEHISLHQQALLIITTMQWFDTKNAFHEKAMQQLEHIRQLAINDQQNGIRWKALADEDDMTIAAEETLALLAEAFSKAPDAATFNNGISQWLLSSKTDHQWRSTKAAAAAIGVLQKAQGILTGSPNKVSAIITGQNMSVTDDLLSGEPFAFIKTAQIPEDLTIKKAGKQAVHGNVVSYHFETASQVSQYNTDIKLSKQLLIYNKGAGNWEPVGEGAILKISDRVKVVLTIETAKNLPYVYIDDKTGGALETANQRSGYQYGNRFSYYRSVRDAGMQFFAGLIPAGKSEISYELTVAREGNFTNGPASLQCMYKPEKAAYSNSVLINTKE